MNADVSPELLAEMGPDAVRVTDLPQAMRAELARGALDQLSQLGASEEFSIIGGMPDDAGDQDHIGDEALHVEFYYNHVTGQDHVRMHIPGEERFKPDFIAEQKYRDRFPRHWAAYQERRSQTEGQTDIGDLLWLDQALIPGLRAKGVHSVEQLAAVSDAGLGMMGWRELREKAQDHVRRHRLPDLMSEQLSERDAQIEALTARLAALEAGEERPRQGGRK